MTLEMVLYFKVYWYSQIRNIEILIKLQNLFNFVKILQIPHLLHTLIYANFQIKLIDGLKFLFKNQRVESQSLLRDIPSTFYATIVRFAYVEKWNTAYINHIPYV